jgi:enamine deaminase RidA (YjgF/YER057c/UK114 family)
MWNYWVDDDSQMSESSIEKRAEVLLTKLKDGTTDNRIIKTTFFLDIGNKKSYDYWLELLDELARQVFDNSLMVTVIPQAPIGADLYLEAWYIKETNCSVQTGKIESGRLINISNKSNGDQLLVISTRSLSGNAETDAENCFQNIKRITEEWNYSIDQMFRQWNYVGDILKIKEGKQNYQSFNEVRAEYFAPFSFPDGYPAATGIGMDIPGVIIEACFLISEKYKQVGISNPLQLSAHHYSDKVLISQKKEKSTPKFERAKALISETGNTVYVSGTAAIMGEDTSLSKEPEEQTSVTLRIINELIARENLNKYFYLNGSVNSRFKHTRVYLKNGYISEELKKQINQSFQGIKPIYLRADVCRDNLLVEIETELQLN